MVESGTTLQISFPNVSLCAAKGHLTKLRIKKIIPKFKAFAIDFGYFLLIQYATGNVTNTRCIITTIRCILKLMKRVPKRPGGLSRRAKDYLRYSMTRFVMVWYMHFIRTTVLLRMFLVTTIGLIKRRLCHAETR